MEPAVSIIIPTYNQAILLKAAIESVIDQTFQNWELIVVNNFSEDETVEVVKSFNDPRISLINFNNQGIIGASRNKGIQQARSEWVAFLDSDDIWYPNKLERCIALLKVSKADVLCHGERWIKAEGCYRDVMYGPESRASYRSLLFDGNCLSTSAVVARRSALLEIGGFSEEPQFVTAEDYDLWLRLARKGKKFIYLPEILGEYRIHPGGTSQGQARSIIRNVYASTAVVRRHFSLLPNKRMIDKVQYAKAIAKLHFSGGLRLHSIGAHREAMTLYARYAYILPLVVFSHGTNRLKWYLSRRLFKRNMLSVSKL